MNAPNLLKAVVAEKIVKLKLLEAQLEEFARTCLKKRKEQNELKDRKIRIKTELENVDKELRQVDLGIWSDATEAQKRQQAIRILKDELESTSREIEIHAVIQQRKDFYAAMLVRLTKLQEELKDTDVECREPKEVIGELRQQIESLAISEYHQLIRSAKGNYDRHIRKQAENKVDGVKVSAKEQFSMNENLDRFLKLDKVIERWG